VLLLHLLWLHAAALKARLTAYASEVTQEVVLLRLPFRSRAVLGCQATLLASAALCLLLGTPLLASVLILPTFSVLPILHARRARRVTAMEQQLDGWLGGLAATLRATPALGEAIEYSLTLVGSPLADELDTLLKELRLGTPLDSALVRMGERIGSRTVQSALGTLRIGQRTGGDIPKILERSAAALREMARLEGVVRVKTAEGKAQASVLALLPFPVIALFHHINPTFLAPLVQHPRGYAVIAVATVLWLSSLVVTRRILRVDI
jgi:tight adherence protein B